MRSLISVIVPVYKCEQYLEQCVNSILSQTYNNLEVILVDDGSPDHCPQLCDALALKDSRIKVFHKSNGGAASARNVGLDNANGEYICFVDSDDTIPKNSIMDLWKCIIEDDCQYAAGICGISNSKKVKNPIKADRIIDMAEAPFELLKYLTSIGSYSPYAKMFKADILQTHGIRYDERLQCSEDALFIRQYFVHCARIGLISKVVYEYNTSNLNSLSKKGYSDFCLYYKEKLKALEKLVEVLPVSDDEKAMFISDRAVHGLYISVQHYFLNWSDKTEIKQLISKGILSLTPFICTPDKISSHEKWWRKYNNLIFENKIDKLYRKLNCDYRRRKMYSSFKGLLKRFLLR